MIKEWFQDQSCLSQRADSRNKSHNPKKLSWAQLLVKMVSVAQKLSTIQERCQDQNCFEQEIADRYDKAPQNSHAFNSQK
jgi:hypothetical protein